MLRNQYSRGLLHCSKPGWPTFEDFATVLAEFIRAKQS